MSAILLDTHAWAWSLTGDERLSEKSLAAIATSESVFVSPISFFEIGQKVRLGKWPQMTPFVGQLPALLEEQGGSIAGLLPQVCLEAALMVWEHRDPFDRLLAVTAMHLGAPIVSADQIFDELPDLTRVW